MAKKYSALLMGVITFASITNVYTMESTKEAMQWQLEARIAQQKKINDNNWFIFTTLSQQYNNGIPFSPELIACVQELVHMNNEMASLMQKMNNTEK